MSNNVSRLPQYQYMALPSKRAIRLVKVSSGPDGIPQCRISVVNLEGRPVYYALSYTWGPPSIAAKRQGITDDRCCPIVCDGKCLLVTRNLFDFLKRVSQSSRSQNLRAKPKSLFSLFKDLRQPHCPGAQDFMWIDAICINQADLDERQSQISIMMDIYRSAKCTVVWLGEEEEDTRSALDMIGHVAKSSTKELSATLDLDFRSAALFRGPVGSSESHWKAMIKLLCRSWFRRVWIIQEFVVANHILVLCGSYNVSWDKLIYAAGSLPGWIFTEFGDSEFDKDKDMLSAGQAFFLDGLRNIIRHRKPLSLILILQYIFMFDATNHSDKIFSILGLVGLSMSSSTLLMVPDYSLPVWKVYTTMTKGLVTDSKALSWMACVEDRYKRQIPELPSWVPDYSSQRIVDWGRYSHSKAAGNLQAKAAQPADLRLLAVVGFKLDEIKEADDQNEVSNETFSFIDHFPRWLDILSGLEREYVTGEARLEVFWRTLIENNTLKEFPASPMFGAMFRSFILVELVKAAISLDSVSNQSSNNSSNIVRIRERLYELRLEDLSLLLPNEVEVNQYISEWSFPLTQEATIISTHAKWYLEFIIQYNRRLFCTRDGFLGVGAKGLRVSDSIWIISGIDSPVILRNVGNQNRCILIGPAYVHGFMQGEALNVLESGKADLQTLILE